jgi:hypothetical protein
MRKCEIGALMARFIIVAETTSGETLKYSTPPSVDISNSLPAAADFSVTVHGSGAPFMSIITGVVLGIVAACHTPPILSAISTSCFPAP